MTRNKPRRRISLSSNPQVSNTTITVPKRMNGTTPIRSRKRRTIVSSSLTTPFSRATCSEENTQNVSNETSSNALFATPTMNSCFENNVFTNSATSLTMDSTVQFESDDDTTRQNDDDEPWQNGIEQIDDLYDKWNTYKNLVADCKHKMKQDVEFCKELYKHRLQALEKMYRDQRQQLKEEFDTLYAFYREKHRCEIANANRGMKRMNKSIKQAEWKRDKLLEQVIQTPKRVTRSMSQYT